MMRKHVICKMKLKIGFALLFLLQLVAKAQVTKVGNDTLLDVAGWNVEWLGNTTNGPSNEQLQYNNVKTVLTNTDMDVWGLAEVCDASLFSSLLLDVPAYDGTLSSFNQTQKTALIWKKSKFDLISYANINDASNSDFYNAFAGRYPLEVALKTKGVTPVDTIYFYVLHLKANSGSADQSSYDRRKNSATYLKTWLDKNRKGKKIIVLGDWNDDVDQSVVMISGSYLQTPFNQFKSDTANYFFPSLRLSLSGETSYPNFNPKNMIDHQLATRVLTDSFYVKNSSAVMKQLGTQVSSYISTTSDHYPVYAQYNLKRYPKAVVIDSLPNDTTPVDTTKTGLFSLASNELFTGFYPNPTHGEVHFTSLPKGIESVSLTNILGEVVFEQTISEHARTILLPEHVSNGLYVMKLLAGNRGYYAKIQLQRE